MNLDKIRNLFTHLSARDLPTGGAALAGTILLLLLFRTGKFFIRLMLFLIAIGLFAGAVWWHQHK
jgi:hypothetical protein